MAISKSQIKHVVLVTEQVVLYTAIVATIAFYGGTQYQISQQKSTDKAVKAAVTAVHASQVAATSK